MTIMMQHEECRNLATTVLPFGNGKADRPFPVGPFCYYAILRWHPAEAAMFEDE